MDRNADKVPEFAASRKLDIELEVAFIVGKENALGSPIPIAETEAHLFGVVLMNDWSARDIQQFEYAPLGPFLGKNFGTTISPWIVTMEALEPFRVPQPQQDPKPLPYLTSPHPVATSVAGDAYDIKLNVSFTPAAQQGTSVPLASSNLKYMYWSFKQQLAHHSVNGCNMRVGDLCGSGTISGPTPQELGSLLEMTGNGKSPFWGEQSFLADGDEVVIRGRCVRGDGVSLGFGECRGRIAPAPVSK
jgi:fumarylacetoacetase